MRISDTGERMHGHMKIIERYPPAMRAFRGSGPWRLIAPIRLLSSIVYGALVSLRRRAHRPPVRIAGRPSAGVSERPRVISIGNLEVGGGGKTPCTLRIAEAIVEQGARPVVLMRGYRSLAAERRRFPLIVAEGRLEADDGGIRFFRPGDLAIDRGSDCSSEAYMAGLIGDEATLYRRRSIPVVIDSDRARGAEAAVRLLDPTHLLLDDGFQNLDIRKDVDILLLDWSRPFGDGRLVPAGTLRERVHAVERADVVLFTRAREQTVPPDAVPAIGDARVFFADHEAVSLIMRDGSREPPSLLAGRRVALYSGVARPESFEALVERTGAEPAVSFRFIDHHRYRTEDILRMLGDAPTGAFFATTEKDWLKSKHLFPDSIDVGAVEIRMKIHDWQRFADAIRL